MNAPYVLQNLYEAAEELKRVIDAIEKDSDECLEGLISIVYRKLNRAYNSRNLTNMELLKETSSEIESRCRFPTELSIFIAD